MVFSPLPHPKISLHHFFKHLFWDRDMKVNCGSKARIRGCRSYCLMALLYLCVQAFPSQQVLEVIHSSHIIFYLMTSITPSSITFTFQTATLLLLINYLAACGHVSITDFTFHVESPFKKNLNLFICVHL